MKNIIKFILIVFVFIVVTFYALAVSPSSAVKKNTTYQVPIFVFVYHSFGPALVEKESSLQTHYRVTAEKFENQMKYLSDNGYHPISFAAYADSLRKNTKLSDKVVVLSFDDGWKTQYKYAVPILEKYKFTATFFIITDYVNNNYKAYMSWNDLKDLVKNNFDIESHTKTHPILTRLDAKHLADELVGSKKILEDKLGIKVTALAYPNYAQDKAAQAAVKNAGYHSARAGWTSFKNSNDHIYELKSQEAVNNPNPFSNKRLPDLP